MPASTYGCSENDLDATLDDEGGSGPVETACPIDTGLAYTPADPLSAFDGDDLAGTWTLAVSDNAGGDVGSLTGWCLVPAVDDGEIFADGFELGTASLWSSTSD